MRLSGPWDTLCLTIIERNSSPMTRKTGDWYTVLSGPSGAAKVSVFSGSSQ
jgi:hypothetical protein